ncbi:MAG TPA: thioesterase family protein, partial [Puia sp.]
MARIKIDLPASFSFTTAISVRITDLNYGAHAGNDTVLSFAHEARVRYLQSLGYSEFNLDGAGLIMADAALVFKNEIYYGDELIISLRAVEFTRVGFDLVYKMEKKTGNQAPLLVALVKTAMVCFDYNLKKIVRLSE